MCCMYIENIITISPWGVTWKDDETQMPPKIDPDGDPTLDLPDRHERSTNAGTIVTHHMLRNGMMQ